MPDDVNPRGSREFPEDADPWDRGTGGQGWSRERSACGACRRAKGLHAQGVELGGPELELQLCRLLGKSR